MIYTAYNIVTLNGRELLSDSPAVQNWAVNRNNSFIHKTLGNLHILGI